MSRVLLVNMPFAGLDCPSLALGLFKSRLREGGIQCDVAYLNFDFAETVGYENYEFMLRLPMILGGEQLFARSLFGDALAPDSQYYRAILDDKKATPAIVERLEEIRRYVPLFLDHCLRTIPWREYGIIGFTSLFEQNLASLSLARLVKQRFPNTTIVFGGANCEDIMGRTMLSQFPFVDYVCAGEADESFPELVARLQYGHAPDGIGGVAYRRQGKAVYAGPPRLVEKLDQLPAPDYDDYFERLLNSPLASRIPASLLIESARGCWWGEKAHCTFCGLNGLTMAFRTKSPLRTVEEITSLVGRYGARTVRFVDNILSPHYFKTLLPELAKRKLAPDYICEVKSNLKKPQIQALADAHVTVQAGIENLSSHVLDLMAKGSNSLMNVQTLKWCKQLGVLADWNFLYGFPGETAGDYRDNLQMLRLLTHLDPPTGCGSIRMDRFSPNYDKAREQGLKNVRPFACYEYIYPFSRKVLTDLVYYFDFEYEQEIDDAGLIPEIEQTIRHWQRRTDSMYVERTGEELIIHDQRPVATWPAVVVGGMAASVYEFCDKVQTPARILEAMKQSGHSDAGANQIEGILAELVARNLMVSEGNRYLSLGVMKYTTEFEQREAAGGRKAGHPEAGVSQLVQLGVRGEGTS